MWWSKDKTRLWWLISLILKFNYFIFLMCSNISWFTLMFFPTWNCVFISVSYILIPSYIKWKLALSQGSSWHLWLYKNQLQTNFKHSVDSHTEIQRTRKISSRIYIYFFFIKNASGRKYSLWTLFNFKASLMLLFV